MVALTTVMSGDQSSGSDGALPPRHREKALSLAVSYRCRGALSVVHLVQRNRKCFTSSSSTPQAQSGDSVAPILCRYLLILPMAVLITSSLPQPLTARPQNEVVK